MTKNSKQLIEHLFRQEYGKLVAILTRIFGSANIQLAEDIVQDTLVTALNHWSTGEIPENPTGWLLQVAKRKVINELKRNKLISDYYKTRPQEQRNQEIGQVFLENEIADSQLRMIFTCCSPILNQESQIALTLKTMCGFGIREVANALLTSEATINKRLYRAKKMLRESNHSFMIPQGSALEKRLNTVILTLYLLFNEGYNSRTSNTVLRKDMCLESMRLTRLLLDQFPKNTGLCALLSLMCFHSARFNSRIDHQSAIILFEYQDRSLWNQELIAKGVQYLGASAGKEVRNLASYHLEALIAATHCLAKNFESTDWNRIYYYYQLLEKIKPNPIIALNMAIIQSKLLGLEESLKLLDELSTNKKLSEYHLLPATQGIFHMKLGDYDKAIKYLKESIALKPSPGEVSYLNEQISTCENALH